MTVLLLARHGETDWNRDGRFQGHADPPLNEAGRQQARALARELAAISLAAIYSSDLPRALETAAIVASARGMDVIADPALREVDVGSWSGLTRREIAERFPGADTHDGESRPDFDDRVLGAVTRLAGSHAGEQILVVTHGGFVRALQRRAVGDALPVLDNCGVYRLRYESGVFRPLD